MFITEGTYASFKLTEESAQALADWIEESGIIEPVPMEDLHVTTTYSEVDVDIKPSDKSIVLDHNEFEIAVFGRALVLVVRSEELQEIHKAALDAGAVYKYETYKPHITLSYNSEANDNLLPLLMVPEFDIELSHEEVEKLNETFQMQGYYKFWGWIDPDGEIILPTKEMRQDRNENYFHIDILPESVGGSYTTAYRQGYIKFLVDTSDKMYLVSQFTASKQSLLSGFRKLEKMFTDEKLLSEIFDTKPFQVYRIQYEFFPGKIQFSGKTENGRGPTINSVENDSAGLRKMAYDLDSGSLEEEFMMGMSYKMWGWISPNGDLLLPTKEHRTTRAVIYHGNILPREISYMQAFEQEWIRFFINMRSELHLEMAYDIDFDNLASGYRKIEKMIITQQDKLREIFDEVNINFLEVWYNISGDSPSEDVNGTVSVDSNPLRRIKTALDLFKERKQKAKAAVSERLEMSGYYDFWGWIQPNGELLLPTQEQAEDDRFYTHSSILPTDTPYMIALRRGWIRFFIEKNVLTFNLSNKTSRSTVSAGFRNIEKFLKENKSDVAKIFGKETNFFDFVYYFTNGIGVLKKDKDIRSTLRQLLSELPQPKNVNEKFLMGRYYDFWGWIQPNGKLHLPTLAQAMAPETHSHETILPDYVDPVDWIKFYIERGVLNIIMSVKATSGAFLNGIRNIERYLSTKDLLAIFGRYKGEVNFLTIQYAIFSKNGMYQVAHGLVDANDLGKRKIINDLNEVQGQDYVENDDEDEDVIDESFAMGEYYDFWGWVKPGGELALPTLEQKNSDEVHTHGTILPDNLNYNKALSLGYIRFHIQYSRLTFEMKSIVSRETIEIGYRNIKQFSFKNKKLLRDVFNTPYLAIEDFSYDIVGTFRKVLKHGDSNEVRFKYPDFESNPEKRIRYTINRLFRDLDDSQTVNEAFDMENYYDFWGWIDKDGDLILPTREQRTDGNEVIGHLSLLPFENQNTYRKASLKGWIRFYIERKSKVLSMELSTAASKAAIRKGVDAIENFLMTRQDELKDRFGRKDIIFTEIAYTVEDGFDILEFYHDKTDIALRRLLRISKLKEEFLVGNFYSFWGWIKPDGELLLPTEEMRTKPFDKTDMFSSVDHTTLLPFTPRTYAYAFNQGWIRFFIEGTRLVLNMSTNASKASIRKGITKIDHWLMNKQKEITSIFDRSNVYYKTIKYDIFQDNKTRVIVSTNNDDSDKDPRVALRNLLRSSDLKEDVPANSTVNVATVEKPMNKTFGMFRRKITDK